MYRKVLTCTSAGTIATQSRQSHGCWEFDVYKGADGNAVNQAFIRDRSDGAINTGGEGYIVLFNNDESIILRRTNIGSFDNQFVTAASYIDINTWYRLKVTRTTDGEFTVLIKGGSFTATIGYDGWTLVQPTGESLSGDPLVYTNNPVTDNTYTTSEYCVLDLDASDKCTNLLFKNQKKVD